MCKFRIIIEEFPDKKIKEIEMDEVIEEVVKDNDIIVKYLNPIISQLKNGTEYIVKVQRIANEDVVTTKDIKIFGNRIVFL